MEVGGCGVGDGRASCCDGREEEEEENEKRKKMRREVERIKKRPTLGRC